MAGWGMAKDAASKTAELSADAIDLAHLDRQTMGDGRLRREVLELFHCHVCAQLPRLKSAVTAKERTELSHSIRSAALGIGAFMVARFAGAIELDPLSTPPALASLEMALEAAIARIRELNGG